MWKRPLRGVAELQLAGLEMVGNELKDAVGPRWGCSALSRF